MPGGVSSPVRALKAVENEPMFIERAKGNKLSPEEIKNAWNKAKKEGKARGKEYRKSMKEEENNA